MILLRIKAGLAIALVVVSSPAFGTSTAEACTYDGVSRTVNIQAPPSETVFAEYRLGVVEERIYFGFAPCGEATVMNTDTIHFVGAPASDPVDEYLGIHVPLTPGFSPEVEGTPEIEVIVEFPYPAGRVDLYGSDGPDVITLGTLGFNVNDDDDLDIEIHGATRYSIEGGPGRDRISTLGGGGTGTAVSLQETFAIGIFGFAGKDRLFDGSSSSILSGGRGRDVVRAGGGKDSLDFIDWYGKDRLFAGGGRDSCTVTRADVTRGCERFPPRQILTRPAVGG